MKRVVFILIGLVLVCFVGSFLAIQIVPYGRNHQNPPVLQEPTWDSAETRALAKRACYDCHSNETVWPWYSNIAPVSWLVQRDVDEGREKLNFSAYGYGDEDETEEIYEVVQEGEMPPAIYLIQHPEARLSQAEKEQLLRGFQKTLGVGQ